MKDLKHFITFENLLQEANNDLVMEAKEEGKLALGYTCYYIPSVLLNLDNCFSVRLRAPRSSSPDIATYYLTNRNCPFSRSLLERAIEGGYHFLDALFGSETCAAMDRTQEHFHLLDLVKSPKFFVTHLDAPLKNDKTSVIHYRTQFEVKILNPLRDVYGVDISEEKLLESIEKHNRLSRVITAIGGLRKLENPPLTSYEFHVICLVAEVCPFDKIIGPLEETLEELKKRKTDPISYRARVVVAGSEIDDPDFTKLVEECGLYVVADRYCYGSLPGYEEIVLREGEDALDAIARHYLDTSQCPRFMNEEKVIGRKQYIRKLVEEYDADGVIFQAMKFCEFWGYERALGSYVLINEMDIPCCTIEREYTTSSTGQLRTRFQAFAESLEYKKLNV